MTRAIDIVVNLWTQEITQHYPPELDQFWDLVKILGMTKAGVPMRAPFVVRLRPRRPTLRGVSPCLAGNRCQGAACGGAGAPI